ncbi:MAG TPA: magnesium transporter CorA family protein, partial [Candidatus Lachnoclostridium stercorigallinarum]|nr:magnesium transporter CorA family protein [Candidatus Lachnoclostridium stercorigallinarum]
NLNIVMKFLSAITIVMSIPTIISGFYGMNVNEAGMPLAGSPWGFFMIILFAVMVSICVAFWFYKKDYL